jgi:excinuclease ABC subunit A
MPNITKESLNSTQTNEIVIKDIESIDVFGAREHNLKNIDISIPRNKLVVITGISGSGKSSLAFDTIYAEGQRRYMESFSAYARSFIGGMERPDVDKINGLSPVISIEQKTTSKNPRSTVGTVTEIYDFMRLFFARTADAFSYETGEKMIRQTDEQILDLIFSTYNNQKLSLLAPVVKGRKGHYRELFEQISKQGFLKVRVDGELLDVSPKMQLDRYKIHDIEIVIDRIIVEESDKSRIYKSVQTALGMGKGTMMTLDENNKVKFYSRHLMCPSSGISYHDPAPNLFSFNSPYGACPECNGIGEIFEITEDSIIPDKKLSISGGAIAPLGEYRDIWIFEVLQAILKKFNLSISTPVHKIPRDVLDLILYGAKEEIKYRDVANQIININYEGIVNFLKKQQESENSTIREWIEEFSTIKTCPSCNGARLKKEALFFKINNKNIAELSLMDIDKMAEWFDGLENRLSERQNIIAAEILKEIRKRIGFLLDVGLEYLVLNRAMRTLSGGESQRIRLATQIGTQLVGVLYIMDEPSIGLHQRDNDKLIKSLQNLRDLGNTVIVVEHDKDMMLASDYIIDIGPGAGIHGGAIVAQGTPKEFLKKGSKTADYLSGKIKIEIPKERRKGNRNDLILSGLTGNNLKNISVKFPLGTLICVTGVSGSGKSTLIHDTLYPILSKHFYKSHKDPMKYDKIVGLEHLDKVIEVDQSPIGRTPRSNPATYTGVFSDIRALFCEMPEAKIRGYKAGRFSFNVKGGRCETCQGGGMRVIEMNFLPDVYVPCETCKGKRYNRETLEVRFKGKSIADVLDMTVEQAVDFFANQPNIVRKINMLNEVGLGYITLGQQAPTLSGGEAQRVKLATELSKKDTGSTMYILDEPTTGLHFQDIQMLMNVVHKLVDKGNSVIIIEHNMDVIKVADYIIDMGVEGGSRGGNVVFAGSPEKLAKVKESYTGKYLKAEFNQNITPSV